MGVVQPIKGDVLPRAVGSHGAAGPCRRLAWFGQNRIYPNRSKSNHPTTNSR